ncbi:teichoic acid ABC transporter ATP-binding protein [Propionigenium maris DSM 9537]|uniref:Teichoic acid ABC transporter ATP-binding protein n=1 Tax=Propionigenium maris DSM 9537 TaxID=1123000 RepID=A0A9W6GN71_9FUSO|nr:ABC transporter ATP-binding protein [Propionigenium maris]GLI56781.1 teichoic acid ABC transporter ATP-binding protein [Propionigenium maris DSM 9537]
MDKNIIEARNLTLEYTLIKRTDLKRGIMGALKKHSEKKKFKALNDVSFEIKHGKKIGLIGSNGSGKSTLLRMLAGTMAQDSGELKIDTESVSLMALGVGFEGELSGRENIYINGLLLGYSKAQIDEKLEEIIEFSELEGFIENPIKTYSSGMKSKLSFAIAAHIEPELLLIDEIFSVGDAKFRKKSEAKIMSLIHDERTVVMVSHNMGILERLCDEVIWLEKGKIKMQGEAKKVLEEYKLENK